MWPKMIVSSMNPSDQIVIGSQIVIPPTTWTLASDNIFSDGYSTQLATVTGDATSGYVATLQVGIAA